MMAISRKRTFALILVGILIGYVFHLKLSNIGSSKSSAKTRQDGKPMLHLSHPHSVLVRNDVSATGRQEYHVQQSAVQLQRLDSTKTKQESMEEGKTVHGWVSAAAKAVPGVVIVEVGGDRGGVKAAVTGDGKTTGNTDHGGRSPALPPPGQTLTSDHWPVFSKNYFPRPVPPSPFHQDVVIRWDFNVSAFLQLPNVRDQPHKLITWMVPPRYMPHLPEPVRLRVCPEMPCRMTTERKYWVNSSALLWNGQIMSEPAPPVRSHSDQVFVFHNNEPQKQDWIYRASFRKPAWKSAFNWTMDNRFDSDLVSLYGYVAKRSRPAVSRNYTDIVAKKTGLVAWMVSHCGSQGQREKYVDQLKKYVAVDIFGSCYSSSKRCPRSQDDSCFRMISEKYKFYLAFENAFCKDYISEKFFRFLNLDAIVVARGSNEYKNHAPPEIFINTADFKSPKELADHLLYLDSHPEDYTRLLKAKDQYRAVTEDWPIRNAKGHVHFMEYHFGSVSFCELCRRLWQLKTYRKVMPDIVEWFDRGNCLKRPPDL